LESQVSELKSKHDSESEQYKSMSIERDRAMA